MLILLLEAAAAPEHTALFSRSCGLLPAAASFYCPYIALMSSGVVLYPASFEPVVSFMTRYGYVELSNQASSLGNAADYLAIIAVTNANVKFQ